jgi:hypothetical protein
MKGEERKVIRGRFGKKRKESKRGEEKESS